MTLKELRDALSTLDSSHDDLDVVLRVTDDEGMTYLGDLSNAAIDRGCTDTSVLMLDGNQDASDADSDPF